MRPKQLNGGKTPAELTGEHVRNFWQFFARKYSTRAVSKDDAYEMKIVGAFLDRIGVVNRRDFADHFTTTVERMIYTPFVIGEPEEWSLWAQISVCTHEHRHVAQMDSEGGFAPFALRYVGSKSERTAYECDAYACDMQLHHWRYGDLLSPVIDRIVVSLRAYDLTESDLRVARTMLATKASIIRRGGIVNNEARVALDYLNDNLSFLQVGRTF